MGGLENYFEVPSSVSVQLESRKHSRLVSRKGFYGTFPSLHVSRKRYVESRSDVIHSEREPC